MEGGKPKLAHLDELCPWWHRPLAPKQHPLASDVEIVAAADRIVVVTLSDDSSGRFLRLLHHATKNMRLR